MPGPILRLTIIAILLLAFAPSLLEAKATASQLFEEGKAHLRNDEVNQAIEKFSLSLTLLPADHESAQIVLLSRAQAYYQQGNLARSRRDINRVLESGKTDGESRATALYLRGKIKFNKKLVQSAIRDFTRAIKTVHQDYSLRSMAYVDRAIAFMSINELDKAVSDLNKAIELQPGSGLAYACRGMAYFRLGKYRRARLDSERALSRDPAGDSGQVARQVLKNLDDPSLKPDKAPVADRPSAGDVDAVTVPVSQQGHIFVKVRFSEEGRPYRFMLDTGATYSLVSRRLLRKIRKEAKVKKVGAGMVRTADGASHRVTKYRISEAFLFDLPLGTIDVLVFNKKRRRPLHLIGVKSLKHVSITIDNANRVAEIRSSTSEDF